MITESYTLKWPEGTDQLRVEMWMIQQGGTHAKKDGTKVGKGLPYHYEAMRKLLWPDLEDHRWNSLCRDEILKNKVTVLMGPGSSGKTHTAAWVHLCEYFIYPEETCVLVSSTDMRGLKMRVWGEIASLWSQAVERYDYLPGHMLDSACAITTDSLEDDEGNRNIRDFRKGVVGIPTMQGGRFVGLNKWVGIKQKRVRLIADEAAMMGAGFLSAFSNLNKNTDFRACVLGNPNDPNDCLGRCAEPEDGWDSHMNPEKTCTWKTRFMNGVCVNLIGTDSPNFDYPENEPTRYKYLISREKIAETVSFFKKDSYEYFSQCVGSMRIGQLARRVFTRRLCEDNLATEHEVNWLDGIRTRVAGLDSAYNGDRCAFYRAEFGKAVGGKIILYLHQPIIIPITPTGAEPEQQISEFVKRECESHGISPENFAHDSTGRGSLGTFLARVWSAQTNPIEFGGQPTDRPVSLDHYINDPNTKVRRLKTEKEHYSKRVSALWFAVRYCIEAGQLRGLTEETMEEGCMRQWNRVANDKLELEGKDDMKLRVGRSPDLMDACSIVVEMARRRGFQISKLANQEEQNASHEWLDTLRREQRKLADSHALTFT